jgi:hypothetical protein
MRLAEARRLRATLLGCREFTIERSGAMTWVQIQKAAETSWADYERVQQAVGDQPPEGLICHVAGEQPDGNWQSVSIWESEEHFNRFRDEKLLPAVRQVLGEGLAQAGPPPTESFEAKHILTP